MRRYLTRLCLFSLPVLAYVAVVVAVDPYNRFRDGTFIASTAKAIVSPARNEALWTVVRLDHSTAPNILLGDSRMTRLDVAEILRVSGLEFANFGMAGASANDVVDLFWRAAEHHSLKYVVIGVNLETFNRAKNRDMVQAAEAVQRNPLLYLSSRDVLLTTARLLSLHLRNRPAVKAEPPMTRDEFWQYQLTYGARRNLQGYQFDTDAFEQYARIGQYCRTHGIRLRFVLLPNQADVHDRIREFGLASDWQALPGKLRAIAETSNFDVDNDLTANRLGFEDPFHMEPATAKRVVDEMFSTS